MNTLLYSTIKMRILSTYLVFAVNRAFVNSSKVTNKSPWACDNYDLGTYLLDESKCSLTTNTISTLLGRGSSGIVRKVYDPVTGEAVAVKTHGLRHKEERAEDYVASIKSEYELASHLWHPNVVETYDLYRSPEGSWHQVMEYLPVELAKVIGRNRVDNGDHINCLFTHVMKAVAHMHSLGIAHMDIKVQNIGIDRMGQGKLFDFGSSQVFHDEGSEQFWTTGV